MFRSFHERERPPFIDEVLLYLSNDLQLGPVGDALRASKVLPRGEAVQVDDIASRYNRSGADDAALGIEDLEGGRSARPFNADKALCWVWVERPISCRGLHDV